MSRTPRNRLADESSPYLRQHADNPVHWQPWDRETLELARETGKPILLSIGYSACHWCHVMAHECFEDAQIAEQMNALFVNIKVDREERPDLDQIYQKAHLLIQQHPGGWPLTMFLTPQRQIPFFGGTYFPPRPRQGLPGFSDVLERVATFHAERADEVEREGASIVAALAQLDASTAADERPEHLSISPLRAGLDAIRSNFDGEHGGFGRAPKFPHTHMLTLLFDQWVADRRRGKEDPELRYQVLYTMERMGLGGLYDHLAGGFFRYATDDTWTIPHFEKMLYDNAGLLGLYSRAARAADDERFDYMARETGAFIIDQLQGEHGGYYSALDADTEGDEGAYYLWEATEVKGIISGDSTWQVLARTYGLDRSPNFTDKWHLTMVAHPQDIAESLAIGADDVARHLALGRSTLLSARGERPSPGLDDKVLTAWNGLTVAGMALAARHTGEDAFARSATAAVDFLRTHLWQDARLHAVYTAAAGARLRAYLDDYVFLIDGLLALLQVRWRQEDLDFAVTLADTLLKDYEDRDAGGFFFTAHDHEALVHRPKPFEDDSTPSGNGMAASVLTRLGGLLGRPDYLEAAERTLRAGWQRLNTHPQACSGLLTALRDQLEPAPVVVLRGDPAILGAWQGRLARGPEAGECIDCSVYAIASDARSLPEGLANRSAPARGVVAYVCEGNQCSPPIDGLEECITRLRDGA
ncbi:MAG: thioredoxin domain-containing protein [Pseudomonadota bacterium]